MREKEGAAPATFNSLLCPIMMPPPPFLKPDIPFTIKIRLLLDNQK